MTYTGRAVIAIAMVVISVSALPNHLKAVVVDTDPAPVLVVKEPVVVVKEPVKGYSASAGLGGPGGLYASADSPLGSASAGVGGGQADTGPTFTVATGHKPPVHQGPGLFDGIFNIPISVLQAVNTYLNNRGPITKPMVQRRRGHHPVVVDKTVTHEVQGQAAPAPEVTENASGSVSASASASASASSSVPSESGAHSPVVSPSQGTVVIHKRVNYDDIFNIPISVLKSVNQLLNG